MKGWSNPGSYCVLSKLSGLLLGARAAALPKVDRRSAALSDLPKLVLAVLAMHSGLAYDPAEFLVVNHAS